MIGSCTANYCVTCLNNVLFVAKGLKVSGKKIELKERLRGFFLSEQSGSELTDDFEEMDDESLRDACAVRGLSDRGSRNTLLKRIREDTQYANELLSANMPRDSDSFLKLSEALSHAMKSDKTGTIADIMEAVEAKQRTESKYIDVTIQSIGMTPEKFTAGGAPSVTADVLRSLAGDPFREEPKYGKVR